MGHDEPVISWQFIFEVFILMLIPFPYYDKYFVFKNYPVDSNQEVEYTYLLSEFMLAFMLFRIGLLVRALLNYTQFNSTYAKRLSSAYGFKTDTFFTIKSLMFIYPVQTCLVFFMVTILIFSIVIRIFEMPFARAYDSIQFDPFMKSVWLTVITLFTIGYGDLFPSSNPGKIVAIFLAFWGAILLALVVVSCSNIFSFKGKQEHALKHLRLT